MKLRGRFTLWFAVAALVTIVVAAVVTREVVTRSFQNDFARTRDRAKDRAEQVVSGLSAGVGDAVHVLANEHPDVRGLLFELQQSGGPLDPLARQRLKESEGALMSGARLDVLLLIDDAGTILSAPHGASAGETDRVHRKRARDTRGKPYFARESILVDGQLQERLVALAAVTVSEGGRSLTVVGGRTLRPELLEQVRTETRVEARVVGANGQVWAQSGDWSQADTEGVMAIALPGPVGETVAQLQVAVSDAGLRGLLRTVTLSAVGVAAGALLLTVLLGFVVARGMTRDLDELVTGVEAVARGDLEHRVAVRKTDEIGAVASAFNDMASELEVATERLAVAQRIAAWQEIARRLAHEIKNPLTPIQMSVESMRKTRQKQHPSFGEVFDESTTTILEEVARLKRIVSEFSEFARMPKPQLGPVDLNDVVTSTTTLYKGTCNLAESLAPDLPEITADKDQLSQVVLNLIENARDAIATRGADDSGGRIGVATRLADGGAAVELVIEDNGPGLKPEIRDKLFTPYFTTKHASGGTGLGLAIVHRIVSDHGGTISAGDADTGGARFTVRLPTAASDY